MGNKNGEVIGPWQLVPGENVRTFWVFDLVTQRCLEFHIDSIFTNSLYKPKKSIQLQPSNNNFAIAANSNFVTTGIYDDNRLHFHNGENKSVKGIGNYPKNVMQENVPNSVHANAYESLITTDPSRRTIFLCARNSDRIDVFSSKGEEIFTISGPRNSAPLYAMDELGRCIVDGENIQGYADIQVTDSYIYALYTGTPRKEIQSVAGDKIFIFTKKGKPLKLYQLDRKIISFDVDELNKKIFAVDLHEGASLWSFNIK